MSAGLQSEQTRPGAPAQFSTRAIFFVAGFAYAAWAPLVPYAKARLGIGDASLGLLLLCLGAGSLLTMPLTATLVTRFGCRAVVYAAVLVSCLTLPLLTIAPTVLTTAAALFVFGAAVGTLDVSISIQAVIVEKASGRAMMSGFHGLFSVGGIVGASLVSALLGFKFAPFMAAGTIAAINAALLLVSGPYLLARATQDQPRFVFPHGFVLFIGVLCFAAFLAEGAMLDWSALFLVTQRSTAPALAGLGYAAFAATMTLGRLTGDYIAHRVGARLVLIGGGLIAACGIVVAVAVPWWIAGLAGFALVGLGASNIVPVFYTALGRQSAVPLNVAVAAITTLGYLGILCGPAFIGFVAQASSLSVALLYVAAMLAGVAACAPLVTR